ncbi:MAG TPA: hypothetical protein VLS27_13070, partial [Gammaproteobacteria bacterium]|nr:hypothetical protein [Gammaproteobacteria bacterium]
GGEPNAELNKATGGMAKEKMTEPKSEFPSATSGGGEPNLELPAKKLIGKMISGAHPRRLMGRPSGRPIDNPAKKQRTDPT